MADYDGLRVWHLAHDLALDVYRVTARFPKSEMFGLTSQMRRAAISIPANVAEGCGRDTDRELARFARISLGSASELDYYVKFARDVGYLDGDAAGRLRTNVVQVKSMLAALARALCAPPARAYADDRRPKTDDAVTPFSPTED